MADDIRVTVTGFQEMIAELQALPKLMQERLAKGALATGASVIRKKAIELAPINLAGDTQVQALIGRKAKKLQHAPGTLKRSIYQTRLADKCTDTKEVWKVDVRVGKKMTRKGNAVPDAYYAMWVEYGHWTRTPNTTKKQHRAAVKAGVADAMGARWVPAQPFMRPAFELTSDEALRAISDYIFAQLPIQTAAFRLVRGIK